MTTLIAIDPGELTGWAVVDPVKAIVVESLEIPVWTDVPDRVEYFLDTWDDVKVVSEKYTINAQTHKKSPQPTAFYINGAVQWACSKRGLVVPLQTPAEAKTFSKNDKLKRIGFWHKGGEGHANDAFRHALLWMVKNNTLVDLSILLGSKDT